MPSVKLELGKYVVVRPPLDQAPRLDGTRRVLFEVPARLRPSGWLPTIALPMSGPRSGDLSDADEVARIQADAADLNRQLVDWRRGVTTARHAERSIETLIETWQASSAWKDNKPRTNKGYMESLRDIRAWAATLPANTDPAEMTEVEVEAFLSIYDERRDRTGAVIQAARPWSKYHVRKALRMVMAQMKRLKWRNRAGEVVDNPVEGVVVPMPKSRVSIWERADVDLYAWAACCAGQRDLAAIILTEWEIGQRLTDAILFRGSDRGASAAEYSAAEGMFRFWQSKTQSYVTIPVSDRLRAALTACRVEGSPYLFHDGGTGRPFRDVNRLSHVFAEVQRMVVAAGGRRLVLRALRHTCVVMLARGGCSAPEIASITGHSLTGVEKILATYLPRDSKVARNAQEKRGLVERRA